MNALAPKTDRRFYEFDGFRVDPVRRRLSLDGQLVPLTPKAFSILLALLENHGEIVEKEELIRKVWPDTFVTEANLTQNVSSLRKALGERASDSRYVVTIPGRGYCFAAEVTEVQRDATGEIQLPEFPPAASVPAPEEEPPAPSAASLPEPAAQPASDPTGPLAVPPPARRSRYSAWLFLVVLVFLTFPVSLFLFRKESGPIPADQARAPAGEEGPTPARRRSVAVLGFRNLGKEEEKSWLATALSEMLTTELAAGGHVRVISGENVSRVRQSLSLPYNDNLKAEDLKRLHSFLSADLVVIGSYLSIGGKIRLDLRVLELPGGDSVASVVEVGTEPELFDLVSRTGAGLRQALGWTGPSSEEIRAARALRPASPEAARLYAEGLARLRTFDFSNARNLLEKAAAADPGSPVIRSALSQAWTGLGYDARGSEEAERAFQLAGSLPKEERLAIGARLHEARKEWDKAGEIYVSLWTFYPDNIEYGLRLANAQIVGGHAGAAGKTIRELRKLPAPEGEDPRIDLAEAMNAKRQSDFKSQLAAARAAETKGRYVNENLVVAQALSLQGDALLQNGSLEEAREAFERGRALFEEEGDAAQSALMLARVGITLHEQSHLLEAEEKFEGALRILDRTGSIAGRALQLGNLGLVWRDLGDLHRSQAALEQARDLYVKAGDRVLETRTRTLLGPVLLARGRIAEGRKESERALAMARQTGTRLDEARALSSLAVAQERQGAYSEALRLHEAAWEIARSLGDVNRASSMQASSADALVYLGHFGKARKRLDEALAVKRKVGDRIGTARILGSLARLSYRTGDPAAAKRYSEEHLWIARQVGARIVEAEALRDQGLLSFAADDLPVARRRLDEALRRLEGLGADLDTASCRLVRASLQLAMENGDPAEIESVARELASWYGSRGIGGHQARSLILAAHALQRQNRLLEAERTAARARTLAVQNEDQEVQVLVTSSGAAIESAVGHWKEALGQLQWAIDESRRNGLVAANLSARLTLGTVQLQMRDRAATRTLQEVHQEATRRGLFLVARHAETALQGVEKARTR